MKLESTNKSIAKGESTTMHCSVFFNNWNAEFERFDVEWVFKNTKIVQTKDKYEIAIDAQSKTKKSSTLTIKKMDFKDGGDYRCRANVEYTAGFKTRDAFSVKTNISGIYLMLSISFIVW